MRQAFELNAPVPPVSEKRWWKVFGVKNADSLDVVFLADKWVGCWTHYDGATFLCDRTPDCRGCRTGEGKKPLGSRWNAYIASYSFTHRIECIVHLTENAARQLLPLMAEKKALRGLHVRLARKRPEAGERSPAKNAPVVVKAIKWHLVETLPPAFPVVDSLIRMWGVSEAFIERGKSTIEQAQQTREGTLPPPLPGVEMIPH